MKETPIPPKDPIAPPGEPGNRFHHSAAWASWIFGGLILLFLMLVVFVNFAPDRFPIIRFFMALSAALFAFFFVGGILLQGTTRGFFVSATGGFVLFILIQFVFDPFRFVPPPPISNGGQTTTTSKLTEAEQSVDALQDAILNVKGDYEAMLRNEGYARERAAEKVYSDSYKLAQQMANLSDANITMMSYQVRKYEYLILAYYMAATASNNRTEKIELSNRAIEAAVNSLDRLQKAKDLAASGNQFHVAKYQFLLKDLSYERIHWYYAVALAINAKAGGTHTSKEAYEVFARVPEAYRREFPPDANETLNWAVKAHSK